MPSIKPVQNPIIESAPAPKPASQLSQQVKKAETKALQNTDAYEAEPSIMDKTLKGAKWGAITGAATIGGGATAALLYAGLSDATIPMAQKMAVLPTGLIASGGFFGGLGAVLGATGGAVAAVAIGANVEDKNMAAAGGAVAGFAAGAAWAGSTSGDLSSVLMLGTVGAAIGAVSSYKVSEMTHQ